MVTVIKNRILLATCMMLLVVLAWQPTALQADALPHGERRIEREIYQLVNEHREEQGLPPMAYNDAIAEVAQDHSSDMARGIVAFGHGGFKDRFDILKSKLAFIAAGAENVAYGAQDAEQAVKLWLRSAGHKKNIQGNFTHTGIGVVRNNDGTLYFTQLFVKCSNQYRCDSFTRASI